MIIPREHYADDALRIATLKQVRSDERAKVIAEVVGEINELYEEHNAPDIDKSSALFNGGVRSACVTLKQRIEALKERT